MQEGTFIFTLWLGHSVGRLRIFGRSKEERAGRVTVDSPALNLFSESSAPPKIPQSWTQAKLHPYSSPDCDRAFCGRAVGGCRRLWTVLATRTGSSACTRTCLLHVPLGDGWVSLHMILEVAVSKEYLFHSLQVCTREKEVTKIEPSPEIKVPNVFKNAWLRCTAPPSKWEI